VRRAYISDIHGNSPALEAVFEDIAARGIAEVWCGGDLVGYGPDPERCIEMVAGRCGKCIMGNHDWALLNQALGFNPVASEAIACSRKVMGEKCMVRPGPGCEAWDFLRGLPDGAEDGNLLHVHASPRDRLSEYVLESDVAYGPGRKIREIFEAFQRLCIVGHSHRPGIVTSDFRWIHPREVPDGFRLEPGGKYLVNDGSVGQPRDGDPRACYAELDGDTVFFHRVEYDVHKTMDMIRRIDCLHPICADRLAVGK
jgi:diadenosine tetraphosphatase ApaH/serine/threonine PP2A family protein phosphatase